jgi:hypothetical protein
LSFIAAISSCAFCRGTKPAIARARLLARAAGAARAPPGRELRVEDQDARCHQALGADDGGREPAQEGALGAGGREPLGDQPVERLEVAAEAGHRGCHGAERRRLRRAVAQSAEHRLEPGELRADARRDLGPRRLAPGREECRGRGHDPLGLAGQLERGERRRRALPGGPLDHPAELEEGPHRRGRGEHRERADAEEGEQQTRADAPGLGHGSTAGAG